HWQHELPGYAPRYAHSLPLSLHRLAIRLQSCLRARASREPGRRQAARKLFHLYRAEDETGVSGTGPAVEGVEFTNGWCAIRWMSDKSTLCFYQSLEDVRRIHGHGGKTELIVHDFKPVRLNETQRELDKPEFELFLRLIEEASLVISQ